MKHLILRDVAQPGAVAPHAGAWIETCSWPACAPHAGTSHPTRVRGLKLLVGLAGGCVRKVAPHAGAWIETTPLKSLAFSQCMSHPTRVRGLKPDRARPLRHPGQVAPHAGAWIETAWPPKKGPLRGRSHPTRVRGLKQVLDVDATLPVGSHPTRVRGLKQHSIYGFRSGRDVAPHAGAWIETPLLPLPVEGPASRTPRGCVD